MDVTIVAIVCTSVGLVIGSFTREIREWLRNR